jgi:hypothetical protein
MAVNAIGIVAPSGDDADAFPAPALAIQHSPVECIPASMMKRDRSLVVWRFACQSLSRIRY